MNKTQRGFKYKFSSFNWTWVLRKGSTLIKRKISDWPKVKRRRFIQFIRDGSIIICTFETECKKHQNKKKNNYFSPIAKISAKNFKHQKNNLSTKKLPGATWQIDLKTPSLHVTNREFSANEVHLILSWVLTYRILSFDRTRYHCNMDHIIWWTDKENITASPLSQWSCHRKQCNEKISYLWHRQYCKLLFPILSPAFKLDKVNLKSVSDGWHTFFGQNWLKIIFLLIFFFLSVFENHFH